MYTQCYTCGYNVTALDMMSSLIIFGESHARLYYGSFTVAFNLHSTVIIALQYHYIIIVADIIIYSIRSGIIAERGQRIVHLRT